MYNTVNCQKIEAVSSYYNTIRKRTELCMYLAQYDKCSDSQTKS